MSKRADKGTFIIRGEVLQTGAAFESATIDLGAFVNALDGAVLFVHGIEFQITDLGSPESGPYLSTDNATLNVGFDLTTQEQTTLVRLTDKSLIASGRLGTSTSDTGGVVRVDQHLDMGPQNWVEGYMLGVDSIYLGTDADSTSSGGSYYVAFAMECSVHKMTTDDAMNLALSQQ